MHTITVISTKQGTVCGTLQKLVIDIKKLIGLPIQVNSRVGALVFIGVELLVVINNEQFQRPIICFNSEFHGAARSDGIGIR